MPKEVIVALIASVTAIISSILAASISVYFSNKKNTEHHTKIKLIQAYKDINSFYHLEEIYSNSIANNEDISITALAVKRSYRKLLRESGFDSPSDSATANNVQKELSKLLSE